MGARGYAFHSVCPKLSFFSFHPGNNVEYDRRSAANFSRKSPVAGDLSWSCCRRMGRDPSRQIGRSTRPAH